MVLVITPVAGSARGKFEAEGGCAGPGGKVDAPELSSGPVCEIQEVSRVGAQGVTSKSKLLAREMPRVCSRQTLAQPREKTVAPLKVIHHCALV